MQRTPDPRAAWRAVEARDARSDGRFVYAVRSTGVYCRPSCPSRRPRRDRVEFFAGPRDAPGFMAIIFGMVVVQHGLDLLEGRPDPLVDQL